MPVDGDRASSNAADDALNCDEEVGYYTAAVRNDVGPHGRQLSSFRIPSLIENGLAAQCL